MVDLRWGVNDAATDDHGTTELCLLEIRRCLAKSISAAFLFFSGERYGWRPLPKHVDAVELEKARAGMNWMGRVDIRMIPALVTPSLSLTHRFVPPPLCTPLLPSLQLLKHVSDEEALRVINTWYIKVRGQERAELARVYWHRHFSLWG